MQEMGEEICMNDVQKNYVEIHRTFSGILLVQLTCRSADVK